MRLPTSQGAVRVVTASLLFVTAMIFVAGTARGQFAPRSSSQTFVPNGTSFINLGGASQTYSTVAGGIDLTGPFFQSMGTNGRSCGSCHQPSDGMSVSALGVEARFLETGGQDSMFRTVDGANCNHNINVSTVGGRYAAYSLLRTRGLIRIALAVPATASSPPTSSTSTTDGHNCLVMTFGHRWRAARQSSIPGPLTSPV